MHVTAKVNRKELGRGSEDTLRLGREGQLIVGNDGPKWKESVLGGKVFIGSNPLGTPVTTQAGLSETTPALTLSNPKNSGVNLILMKVNIVVTAAPAANTILCLAANTIIAAEPTALTSATVRNAMIGVEPSNRALCSRVATLAAAPVAIKYLGGILAAASTGECKIDADIDGEIIIPPGGCISIQATTAVAILASMTWEEEPV